MKMSPLVQISIGLAGAVIVGYVAALAIVNERLEDARAQADLAISNQQTTLATLSEVMARGGVDSVTDTVIKDCSPTERNNFDSLLGRLGDGLSAPQLSELSRLFDRCAAFYARQKAVMAARLEREVEIYELLTKQRAELGGEASDGESHALQWTALAEREKELSVYFEKLVVLQGQIIEARRTGESVTGEQLTGLLSEVREVLEQQAYTMALLQELRAGLPTSL